MAGSFVVPLSERAACTFAPIGEGGETQGGLAVLLRVGRWLLVGPFLYGICAFPLTIVGRARQAAEIRRRWLDRRGSNAGGQPAGPTDGHPADRARSGIRVLPMVPLTLLAFLPALLIAYLIWAGQLYPLRPDTIGALAHPLAPAFGPGTWGGPTLIGAWAAHAVIAFGLQIMAGLVIRGLAMISRRVTEPRLGS